MVRRLGEFLFALVACALFDWKGDALRRPGAARRDSDAGPDGEGRGDLDPGVERKVEQTQAGGLVWGPGLESRFRRRHGETSGGGEGNSRDASSLVARATPNDDVCGAG